MPNFLRKRAGAKTSLVILSIFLFLFIFSYIASAAPLGDVNDDGEINVLDVVLVMKHVLEIEELDDNQQKLADVNCDGVINVQDVTLIMQYALGLIDEFPCEPTKVVSVKALNKTVPYGTGIEDIDFPSTVEATVNATTMDIDVVWEEDSTPPYNAMEHGNYVFYGELVNLPEGVGNPDGVKAKMTVMVGEEDWIIERVSSELEFQDAMNTKPDVIVLDSSFALSKRYRIEWDLKVLELNGFSITLNKGPLTFEGDGTHVMNGRFNGDLNDSDWDQWQYENAVLADGDSIKFSSVVFNVKFADWYQNQASPATNLVISSSSLLGKSLFVSDVEINDTKVYNKIGIEDNAAELNRVSFHAADGSKGILYVNSDAYLYKISWLDNFTGMYVGKSLKYGTYSPAEPKLEDATIFSDKYGLVWWAINHDKAKLHTCGVVKITSDPSGPGLMLVGTDARDYESAGTGDQGKYDGGQILGSAVFVGDPVWFGKPTADFLQDGNYEGGYTIPEESQDTKDPVCIDGVDPQVCKKDADRLYIHGPAFDSDVYIFTPINNYIGCSGDNDGDAPLMDSVWLGDVEFHKVYMWGDFTIINRKTVQFDQIELMCGNIRGIFTEGDLRGSKACPATTFKAFDRYGTLQGGRIISDTKADNVLVLGDGLLVKDVELSRFLHNVILETVKLEEVDINVGTAPINDVREVCGYTLDGDVFVWPGHNATFNNVMWSPSTRLVVMDNAKLNLKGNIDNYGSIKLQTYAFIDIDDDAVLFDDIRAGHSVVINDDGSGYVYVTITYPDFGNWIFENWKADFKITKDPRAVSTKFEILDRADMSVRHIVNLIDPDIYDWDIRDGVKFTEMLGLDPATYDLQAQSGGEIKLRIRSQDTKTFDLAVESWAVNCCGQQLIEFASDKKEVTTTGKEIQIPRFDISNVQKDRFIEAGSTNNAVTFTVTNNGTESDTQKIILLVDGVKAAEAGPFLLGPGKSAVATLNYDAPAHVKDGDVIEIRIQSHNTVYIQKVYIGEERYHLTMAADPGKGGTATDETDEGPYEPGTEVDIKATANPGYKFSEWTADAGSFAYANEAETTFTMPAQDVTVTANFITGKIDAVSAADLVYSPADSVYKTEWSFVITEVKLDQGQTVTIDLSEALTQGLIYSTDNSDYEVDEFTVNASNAQDDGAERIVLTALSDIDPGTEVEIAVSGITPADAAVVELKLTITRDDTGEFDYDYFIITNGNT